MVALRATHSVLGTAAMRGLYNDLLKVPCQEDSVYLEVLEQEMKLQGSERLAAVNLEAIFEVRQLFDMILAGLRA